jgi:uncharacterized membrane protein YqaE (UPF0057 family)
MSLLRAIICIIFPPLAVLDKGCGTLLLVTLLTIIGWIPGVIAALVVCSRDERPYPYYDNRYRY